MKSIERRRELAHFLRTRREQVTPEQIGLRSGARRRTTGLRREELAQLAGVGLTWYTWLEQGRDIKVSDEVVESLARSLCLMDDERDYLFSLARDHIPLKAPTFPQSINSAVQYILDDFRTCPAYVTNPAWDMIGWNRAASIVFATDFVAMQAADRNLLRFMFTNTAHRQLLVDWEGEARGMLALFRASTRGYINDPWFSDLIDELTRKSVEFHEWWTQHDVRGVHGQRKVLNHPIAGYLVLMPTTLYVSDNPDLRLVMYTPLPETEAPAKVRQLIENTIDLNATTAETE